MERASLPQLQFDPSRLWRAIHVPEPSRATTIHTAPPTGYLEECDRERRDGPSSKPLVTIYRSTRPNQTGSVMKENTRVLFKQKPIEATNDPAEPEFGVNEDLSLTGKGERRKELLIFVRRVDAWTTRRRRTPISSAKTYEETIRECPGVSSEMVILVTIPGMWG